MSALATVLVQRLVARRFMHNETDPISPAATPPVGGSSTPAHAKCASCAHFDLEEGQAVIAQFPAFVSVASLITPAQIGRHVVRDYERDCRICDGKGSYLAGGKPDLITCKGCEGTGKISDQELSAPGAPMKAKWSECGACLKDGVVIWGGDKKSCWEAPTP